MRKSSSKHCCRVHEDSKVRDSIIARITLSRYAKNKTSDAWRSMQRSALKQGRQEHNNPMRVSKTNRQTQARSVQVSQVWSTQVWKVPSILAQLFGSDHIQRWSWARGQNIPNRKFMCVYELIESCTMWQRNVMRLWQSSVHRRWWTGADSNWSILNWLPVNRRTLQDKQAFTLTSTHAHIVGMWEESPGKRCENGKLHTEGQSWIRTPVLTTARHTGKPLGPLCRVAVIKRSESLYCSVLTVYQHTSDVPHANSGYWIAWISTGVIPVTKALTGFVLCSKRSA